MIKTNSRPSEQWERGYDVSIKKVARVPGGEAIFNSSYVLAQGEFEHLLYNPMDYRHLPNAFAKVKDEKTAIRFAKRWGLLGYNRLHDLHDMPEPLDWVLRQARSVRFVLNLLEKYNNSNYDLIRFLKNESVTRDGVRFKHTHYYISGIYDLAFGVDCVPKGFFSPAESSPDERKSLLKGKIVHGSVKLPYEALITEFVNNIIVWCINGNTANVSRDFYVENGKLLNGITYKALIEVIWYQVGDIALKAQEGGEMRVCDYCKMPFLAEDGRQRFCPPLEIEGQNSRIQSACGLRYRQRKIRINKKLKEVQNER